MSRKINIFSRQTLRRGIFASRELSLILNGTSHTSSWNAIQRSERRLAVDPQTGSCGFIYEVNLRRKLKLMSAKFTFFAENDKVEVRLLDFEIRSGENVGDTVWLDSTVTVKAGAFLGSFKAAFTTHDLVNLHEQLKSALESQSGKVSVQSTEGDLSLAIEFDGHGGASMSGVATPHRLRRATLHFHVDTDQFALFRTLHELEDALQEFPVKQPGISNGPRAGK
jgi:hypothetical protein